MREQAFVQEEVQEMSPFQRVMGIYFSPGKTFQYLRQRPTWLLPFIIISLVAMVSNYLIKEIAIQERIYQIEMSDRIP
ncbi:MAG: hypothetical protein ACE5OR_08780, partial [bacterium]